MEIEIDALQDTVNRILEVYGDEAEAALEKTATKVAKNAKKKLRTISPRSTKNGKHYAEGWSYRVEKSRVGITKVRVFNSQKAGLTHLLEDGHETRNGNGKIYPRTPAHPHIQKVNDEAQLEFVDQLEAELGF